MRVEEDLINLGVGEFGGLGMGTGVDIEFFKDVLGLEGIADADFSGQGMGGVGRECGWDEE